MAECKIRQGHENILQEVAHCRQAWHAASRAISALSDCLQRMAFNSTMEVQGQTGHTAIHYEQAQDSDRARHCVTSFLAYRHVRVLS